MALTFSPTWKWSRTFARDGVRTTAVDLQAQTRVHGRWAQCSSGDVWFGLLLTLRSFSSGLKCLSLDQPCWRLFHGLGDNVVTACKSLNEYRFHYGSLGRAELEMSGLCSQSSMASSRTSSSSASS